MIKLVYCVRKRADVDDARFHRYWLEEHGPLVKRHAAALGAVRYVQSHTLDTPANDAIRASRGTAEPYDGITEVWWESAEAMAAAAGNDGYAEAAKALLDDESTFIDFSRSRVFFTEEHEIF